MRGKLRDKRDTQRDHSKREMLGRRTSRRENRDLNLLQVDDNDEYVLDEKDELLGDTEQQH